jgi:hypothetical protein
MKMMTAITAASLISINFQPGIWLEVAAHVRGRGNPCKK